MIRKIIVEMGNCPFTQDQLHINSGRINAPGTPLHRGNWVTVTEIISGEIANARGMEGPQVLLKSALTKLKDCVAKNKSAADIENTNKEVFLIITSAGVCEDYRTSVYKAFAHKVDAEDFAKEYNSDLKVLKKYAEECIHCKCQYIDVRKKNTEEQAFAEKLMADTALKCPRAKYVIDGAFYDCENHISYQVTDEYEAEIKPIEVAEQLERKEAVKMKNNQCVICETKELELQEINMANGKSFNVCICCLSNLDHDGVIEKAIERGAIDPEDANI